jgi:purine-binding chemotaxis protein CheW
MTTSDLVQLCVLQVGATEYAIDLKRVDEILIVPEVTVVPRSPSFLEGVVKLRGEVVPVIDVRKRLGVASSAVDRKSKRRQRLLICKIGRRRVGFLVDAVIEIARVRYAEIRPAPLAEVPGQPARVVGVCGPSQRLRLLLDVKAFLHD